ncbi:MAG TPA: BadF/BadG/BcrA/BcrD ATPase family protein, partial [Candidatus Binatia bacterium]|nr:BadF/BadG/BcrA/BcrD ATPase family protein [Candidatus Binatia bacterium]
GLAVVAGTGSIAYARAPDGRTARAGGWGYLLGDEGSGYALTLAGLQAVARAADGRAPATRMTDAFLNKLGLSDPHDLIPAVYRSMDRADLAALAPVVLDAADAGDTVTVQIVETAAHDLAATVAAAARALGLDRQAVPLALAGGVLLASASYRQRLLQALTEQHIRPAPIHLVHEPAEGAVRETFSIGA